MTFSRLRRVTRYWLRSVLRPQALDDEAARELAFHLELLVRENLEAGMTPEAARRAAHRALGNTALLAEQCRDQRGVSWLHDLQQDLVYGLRMLAKHRGFTVVAVASLALGIGANAALLDTIQRVLLQPLALPDADRLVLLRTAPLDNPSQQLYASLPDYVAWRERSRAFESMGATLNDRSDFAAVEGDDGPVERLEGMFCAPSWFATVGVQPALGTAFQGGAFAPARSAENHLARADATPVVVISHRLWQRRFEGDPRILGRQVRINGTRTTIIGVMPSTFTYPDARFDYWLPLRLNPIQLRGSARFYMVTARLKSGVTPPQAQAELNAIAAQLARDAPERHRGWGVRVQAVRDALYGWTITPLLTLQTAVALVLLIACVNVAGLLLARGRARAPELALRAALGAGRGRLVRQLLAESVLLALIGGLIGVFVAWWGLRALAVIAPPPGFGTSVGAMAMNPRIIGVMALLSVVTGLAFGVAPAFIGSRGQPTAWLGASSRGGTSRQPPLWGTLVIVQIALALIVLTGAGLLANSFMRLANRDLVMDPNGLVTFEYRMLGVTYTRAIGSYRGHPYLEIVQQPSIRLERIVERLRMVPGAESVAGISYPHFNALLLPTMPVVVDGDRDGDGERGAETLTARYFLATPNLFTTLRAPLLRGRDFEVRDTGSAPWVAIVNEAAARRFWPGRDPLGQTLTLDIVPEEQPRTVIGVARDIPLYRTQQQAEPVIYASYLQQPSRYRGPWGNMFGQMTFIVRRQADARGGGDLVGLVREARRAVAEIDPDRPIADVAVMDEQLALGLRGRRTYALWLGLFAAVATGLAAIGIYGVMAYGVAQRVREIGIRRALGADAREIVALVGAHALRLIVIGLVLGIVGAWWLTRLIAAQLWGVTPTDPVTFTVVSLLLVAVALLASFIPMRRALRVDPTVALKYE